MTDHITLPRAVVEQVREALKELDYASEPYVNEIARTTLTALEAAIAEPEPEPDALRRDAERYRWLKSRVEDYDGHACFGDVRYPAPIPDRTPFDAIDAAIDAAMQEDKT